MPSRPIKSATGWTGPLIRLVLDKQSEEYLCEAGLANSVEARGSLSVPSEKRNPRPRYLLLAGLAAVGQFNVDTSMAPESSYAIYHPLCRSATMSRYFQIKLLLGQNSTAQ